MQLGDRQEPFYILISRLKKSLVYGDAVECNGIKVKDVEEALAREDLDVKEYCQYGDRLAYLVCSKSNEESRINLAGEVLLNFLEEDE